MKLNQKTSRLQLLVLLLVMPIGGVAMFFGLRYFFEGEVDEKLLMDEIRITNYLKKSRPVSLEDITYECQVVDDSISPLKSYSKGFVKDLTGGGRELFKSLTVIKNIDGVNYRIVLHEPVLENKDFIYVIVMTIAIFLVTSFILFLLLFYKVQSAVWAPFFKSLNSLKKFSLGDSIVPKYDRVAIEEFDSLNKELTLMTEKIVSDYKILKEFSENAAHETQTPLAIISLEIDELLQIDLPMEVTQRLYNIFQAINRLSNLNEKLLLLTKIENYEFKAKDTIDLAELALSELNKIELITKKSNISITSEIINAFKVKGDGSIITILIDNLLSNAIKHNIENGYIKIVSKRNSIRISNSFESIGDVNKIFNRFYKSESKSSAHGLGLSISEKIAKMSHLTIVVEIDKKNFSIVIRRNLSFT